MLLKDDRRQKGGPFMHLDVEIDNEELYKQTFHQAFVGMTLTNEEGKFLEVNEMFCNMLDYSKEQLKPLSFQEVTHPDDLPKNLMLLEKLINWEISTYQIEKRYICKGGQVIWAITNVARVKDSHVIIAQIQDITKLKQKERMFKEKEASYHLMTEYSTDLIMRHHPNGEAFCVSPSSKELLGYESHELIGISPYDLTMIHPDDLPRTIESHQQIPYERSISKIRYRVRRKTGDYTWIESTAKGIFNKKNNQLEEIVTVSRDCTDHVSSDVELKKAKEKLEKSNELINNIFDSITDGFLSLDYNGNIIYLNNKVKQALNVNRREIIGKKVWSEFPFLKGTEFEQNFFKAIHKQVPTQYEKFSEEFNGWLEVRLYPKKEIISISLTDITQRKKFEQKLKESEQRYRTIVESSKDGIGIHIDDKFVFANQAFLNQMGATHFNEVINQPVHKFLPPEEQKKFDERMNRSKEQKTIQSRFSTYTVKLCNGSFRDVEVTADKIIYNGKPATQFIARDITERKSYDQFLHKVDKLKVVGELAAGVAHEIRNPLTTIKGFIQFFQSTREYNQEYFNIINTEFQRMEEIIYEFLTLAKPHHEINFKKENLCNILKEVITLENTNAILKNIELHFKYDLDMTLLYCDKNSLKQVFINIFQNAIEATSENGKIEISIKKQNNNLIEINCKDNGCGIPKHLIHRLGEPFYTLKEKGTGLGLMICFKIIENHNGSISINSEEGVGTTVSIQLPVQPK